MKSFMIAAAAALIASPASAQAPVSSSPDLVAIDKAISEVYGVISGPPGQKRDFDRMRAMFAPNALLRVITPTGLKGGTLDEYIAKSGPTLEKEGFTETELGRRTEIFGNLASVWSSYDGRTATGTFKTRGVNSFQLVKSNGKWLVASILWQQETPQLPLPSDLAGSKPAAK